MAEYIEREAALSAQKKSMNLSECRKRLERIPAADMRPVVRARWNTVKYPLYECSNCGAVYQEVGYGFNFCPNCGARMDGEEDV